MTDELVEEAVNYCNYFLHFNEVEDNALGTFM
jgi:hypothetical protein